MEGLDKGDLEGRRKRMATIHTELQEMGKTLMDPQVARESAKRRIKAAVNQFTELVSALPCLSVHNTYYMLHPGKFVVHVGGHLDRGGGGLSGRGSSGGRVVHDLQWLRVGTSAPRQVRCRCRRGS